MKILFVLLSEDALELLHGVAEILRCHAHVLENLLIVRVRDDILQFITVFRVLG